MSEKYNFKPNSEKINTTKGDNGDLLNTKSLERELKESKSIIQKLTKGLAILGFCSFTLLSSGCATGKMGLTNTEIQMGFEKAGHEIEDPNGYLKYLEDREFVIKNEIFDSYSNTVDKRFNGAATPVGGYIARNYLDTTEEQEELRQRLDQLGISKNDISFYEKLFISSDVIILRESILKKNDFLETLSHERLHKKLQYLKIDDYKIMAKASRDLMRRQDENGDNLIKEKYSESKTFFGLYIFAAAMNWEEFYTYLAQGEFDDSAEQILKDNYLAAYKIFNEIRESCKIKEIKE